MASLSQFLHKIDVVPIHPLLPTLRKLLLDPLYVFSFPTGTILSFKSRGHWKDTARRRDLPSGSSVPGRLTPAALRTNLVPSSYNAGGWYVTPAVYMAPPACVLQLMWLCWCPVAQATPLAFGFHSVCGCSGLVTRSCSAFLAPSTCHVHTFSTAT